MPLSSMFMWSHWDCVCGVAHSLSGELNNAQAESGTEPNPARLNANTKISNRFIAIYSTRISLPRNITFVSCYLLRHDLRHILR